MSIIALNLMAGTADCFEYLLFPAEEVEMTFGGYVFPAGMDEQNEEPVNFICYVPKELRGLSSLKARIVFETTADVSVYFDTDFYTYASTVPPAGNEVVALASQLNPAEEYPSNGVVGYSGMYVQSAEFEIGALLTVDTEWLELQLRRAEDEPEDMCVLILAYTLPEQQEDFL